MSRFEDSGPPRNSAERRVRVRLQRLQRPVTASVGTVSTGSVERAVTIEGKQRFVAGELPRQVRRTSCEAPRRLVGERLGFLCVAVTAAGSGVIAGQPVVANAAPQERTVTFCFRVQSPGEMSSLSNVRVALRSPCRDVLLPAAYQ